ncbi:MAG: hypothetical protein AB3N18_09425, partial [Allomuricauda sp.]
TTSIIEELNVKSKEASDALDNLKSESNRASQSIANEIESIREKTEAELEKLSYPIPSDLFATSISINIKPEGLSEFLEPIRTKYNTHNLDAEHLSKEKFAKTNRSITPSEIDNGIFEIFENKTLSVLLQFGDDNGPFGGKEGISWRFTTKVSISNADTHLLYFIDNQSEQKEYFRFMIGNNTYIIKQTGRLRLYKGISSVKEICGKKFYLSYQFDNDQRLLPPVSTLDYLYFKDDNSREYFVEVNGTKTIKHPYYTLEQMLEQRKNPSKKIEPSSYFGITYVTGILKCLSF